VSADSQQLSRYLDGDMSPPEVALFEGRLRGSARLRRELEELRRVGAAIRRWSREAEDRAGALVEPTIRRAVEVERRRSRLSAAGYVAAALSLATLPWAGLDSARATRELPARFPSGAAIERVDASDRNVQVFVVGSSSTPVLWLVDDAPDELGEAEQEPG
jgi:hypothetical protein